MLEFTQDTELTATAINEERVNSRAASILVEGEHVIALYRPQKHANDQVIFTNRRIIYADPKDIANRKAELSVLPYKEIRQFTVETPGMGFSGDSKLHLILLNGTTLDFNLHGTADIIEAAKAISEVIL
ncbi:MAG: PH domain-containing protein [Solobacterium sp.]|nr:PH domain-containing protein [Solobacterium sp.]